MASTTRDALARAKGGKGPTFIECVTYRMGLHTTADDPGRYRMKAEEAEWQKKDPILRFREYLKGKGVWTEAWQAQIDQDIEADIRRAVESAEAEREFDPADMFDYVFASKPPYLQAQQAELRAVLSQAQEVSHA
jgi:pyruvate dehydrogenase E1 component alpha subunit